MGNLRGLEGLRGWLAWAVVLSHILQINNAAEYFHISKIIFIGDVSVQVFIVISGFVITHLLLSKQERYTIYITRRALRIFPSYLICFALGIVTSFFHWQSMTDAPWPIIDSAHFAHLLEIGRRDFWPYALSHLVNFHGIIPTEMLENANLMFLDPAWSLSLEWQFYLVAPMIIAACRSTARSLVVAAVFALAYIAYVVGFFGTFGDHPSIIFGAAPLFAVGIITRFMVQRIGPIESYPFAALIILSTWLVLLNHQSLFLVIWLMVVSYALIGEPADRLTQAVKSGMGTLLDSRFANWLGARSYATYIVHYPLLQLVAALCAMTRVPYEASVILICALSVVLTVAAAEVLHRYVEMPSIALGRRIANRQGSAYRAKSGGA